MDRDVIDLFKVWTRDRVLYTGRTKNANKMLRILPLFQGFVRAHTDYFAQEYAYFHRGEAPGPLSPVYSIFRDRILLVALEEIRTEFMESMGHDTDGLETLRYVMKHTTRTNGTRTPRAILGWESV